MSMPRLSHFPDLCLLAIFKHIPLVDVIRTVGRVCSNWTRVAIEDLRRRKKLTIFQDNSDLEKADNQFGSELIYNVLRDDGSPWVTRMCSVEQTKFDAVQVPHCVLTEAFTNLLMDLLSNITHLTIVQDTIYPRQSIFILEQIRRLIRHNASNLVSLKLDFGFPKYDADSQEEVIDLGNILEAKVLALFDSINRLESLRHLTLNVNLDNLNVDILPLNQLTRLATFTSREFYPSSLLFSSLCQFIPGEVRIEGDNYLGFLRLNELDPQLASRFTRMCIQSIRVNDYKNTRLFCTRFNSLITLELSTSGQTPGYSMPMTVLSRALSQLTQLINLKLTFIRGIPEVEQQLEISQMPSVRLLTLIIRTDSHDHAERLHVHSIFPNLQVLHFTNYAIECVTCDYNFKYSFACETERTEMLLRIGHCLKLSRQPFRRCAKLHTIKLDSKLKNLLPQDPITIDQL